jgi:UDP-glucuronate decarboxylase
VEVDEVYNLACPASPVQYQKDPIQTCKTSVLGSINLLGLAKRLKIKYLVASTSEVYGDPHVHPQTESYWGNVNPIGPRSCYDEGKRVAETLASDYRRQLGIDTKIIRIFNTYGPRMRSDDGRVVSNFINDAIRDRSITIYGSGSQTRSFCYVSDLVRGMVGLMNSPSTVSGPINMGNPEEYTIAELAELIVKMTGSKSNMSFHDLPVDDPKQRKPDITLAKSILGWTPSVSVNDGLKSTIEYFKELM